MFPEPDEAEKYDYLFGKRLPSVSDLSRPPLTDPMERHVVTLGKTSIEAVKALQQSYPQPSDSSPPHFEPGEEPATDPADVVSGEGDSPKTAWELWQLHAERRDLQKSYLDHWAATGNDGKTGTGRPVDAIIAPVAPYPAPPHGYNS